ncbi:MAG: hypothetical protein M1812_000651 [Candelaria pacifica]|nr:MAG: hypothetical protein M1812_000651 [Candelaria pacifica]
MQENRKLAARVPVVAATASTRNPPKEGHDGSYSLERNVLGVDFHKSGNNLAIHVEDAEESSGLESEGEDEEPNPTASDKRRAQNAKFKSWAELITKEDVQEVVKLTDDDKLSTRNLMSKQESTIIITDPREYQLELFERAKKQNIIAVLDTGSGKTLIAVLLLKYTIDQELEDRALGKQRRISFFLVDCVTLVFQQYAVLECNLDQNIERFCGDMGCDLWHKATWDKHFAENMVIVCTAEVLYQCLMHSFITLNQINLLIFDEAHHAKKNHAYARIIKDFYLAESEASKRPKVFGMTASPVDARVDVVKAAKDLESLLHCQIATTSDLSLLQRSVSRPKEALAQYGPLLPPFETPLYNVLKSSFGDIEVFSKLFKYSREASSQLGSWCADQIWTFGLAEEEGRKVEGKVERRFLSRKDAQPVETLDADIARIREAREVVSKHIFRPPIANLDAVSDKVLLLHKHLTRVFERPSEARCIVFVKRRYTARLLGELFSRIGTTHMRSSILIGTRTGEAGDLKVSFRQQVVTLMKFRKGELNCLFATSIAEEGLDIPDCNLVVRFDLYSTLIQFIQSRGRARHSHSKYIHMIENGNQAHLQAVREVRLAEGVMRQFCESLPADRLLHGNDYDLEGQLGKEKSLQSYTEPETGAKLTYGSSLAVLAHFVGCLPHGNETTLQVTYVMSVQDKKFVCEVILPENSPIRSAIGRPATKKSIAKRAAAFSACILLRKSKHLDSNLLPTYTKHLPAMRNALLALSMKKTNKYGMRVKPDLWEKSWGSVPNELFLTLLELKTPQALGRPYQPLAILTRTRLPNIPEFLLYPSAASSSAVICTSLAITVKVTPTKLTTLNNFTLRIFSDVFNKVYESEPEKMSYWLAPVDPARGTLGTVLHPEALIDWDTMELAKKQQLEWNMDSPDSFFADKFVVDPWNGSRRFFSVGAAPQIKPLDPVPPGTPKAKQNMKSILDYSNSMYKNKRQITKLREDQPVFLAHFIHHRRNFLDEMTEKEKKEGLRRDCYLCPEILRFSTLPIGLAAMCLMFPPILSRIESHLIALDACKLLHITVEPALALEAVTKDSDNTDEHSSEQINFRRGMGNNYERLEFIGDCFLKMATSISLFAQNPDNDEFEYHVKRMLLICNKNLFNTATQLKLPEYIRSQSFARRTWYPEGLKLLQGKDKGEEPPAHNLGDKTVADVCEALIGAALVSHAHLEAPARNFDNAVKAVTALVRSSDHEMTTWSDYYKVYNMPTYQISPATASQTDLAAKVNSNLGYQFRYPRLLRSAFIHPSYPFSWEKVPCYQRLEFLGDALLDMACIDYLFYKFPKKDPQWLTEHKMAMVSNKFLGAVCVKLGFHKHLRYNGALVEYQIRDYVTELQEAEIEAGGARDYWTQVKNPPKCLPDVVEAYVGAVFVDSEFDYDEVEGFFKKHIEWFFEDMTIYDTFANNHPTTFLHNLLTITFGCQNYRLLAQEMPSIDGSPIQVIAALMIHNEVVAEGRAASGKNAKVKASSNALEKLKGLAPYEYRMQYRCDCSSKAVDENLARVEVGELAESAI